MAKKEEDMRRIGSTLLLSAMTGSIVLPLSMASPAGWAQTKEPTTAYPGKPIRIVSGSGPGSGNDILARLLGQALSASLKQPVVVDNRPGASGALGAEHVAKSSPDGYTLLLGFNGNLAVLRVLRKQLPYDPLSDFSAISRIASIPAALVVHPSVPARSVKELIALAKARPGELNFATYGVGSGSHMAGELFKSIAGIDMTSISYKSSTQGVTDLAGGHVHLMIHSAPVVLPLARSGKLRALAVTSAKRSPVAPELPTMAEAGVPNYELSVWFGMVAPAGTPSAIVEKLNREIVSLLNAQEMRSAMLKQGFDPNPSSAEELSRYIRSEVERYTRIVKAAGIPVE
jgi:tripartite-type tricarboxylate transporter receptor subunit TctC